jgi:hypothetical protein
VVPSDELPLAGVDEALWMSPAGAVLRRGGSDAAGAWRGDGRDPGGVAGVAGSDELGVCVRRSVVDLLKRRFKFKKVAMAHSILVESELPSLAAGAAGAPASMRTRCRRSEAGDPVHPLISSIINDVDSVGQIFGSLNAVD